MRNTHATTEQRLDYNESIDNLDNITWLKCKAGERWYEINNDAGYTESHDAVEKNKQEVFG